MNGLADMVFALMLIGALGAALRGGVVLFTRRPAPAIVIYDGYEKARRLTDRSFIRDNPAIMPFRVVDRIQFEDVEGNTVRADLRRWALPRDPTAPIWFDRANPQRVTSVGPLVWFACAAAIAAGALAT